MPLKSAQLGAMALGRARQSQQPRSDADDCMSIDWTLNMRRKCSRFFSDRQQYQQVEWQASGRLANSHRARKSQISDNHQEWLHRSRGQVEPTQIGQEAAEQPNLQELGRDKRIKSQANMRQVSDKRFPPPDSVAANLRVACSPTSNKISDDLASLVNYEQPTGSQEDRLSALSASSSLLSQLLNSSLNQLIELDNGSSGLSCTCCAGSAASACATADHRPRQVDQRDLQVSQWPARQPRPLRRYTLDSARPRQFDTQRTECSRAPLTCSAPEGQHELGQQQQVQLQVHQHHQQHQQQQQHDSLLDETSSSQVSPLSMSSSLSTCPCNFKSCQICMLQIASKLSLVQHNKHLELPASACDNQTQGGQPDFRQQRSISSEQSSVLSSSSSCAVRVTTASEGVSSDDSLCKPADLCMGLGWSAGREQRDKLAGASNEHLEWLSSGAFYADIKSTLACEPLLLPVVLTQLNKPAGEPIFELDPRDLQQRTSELDDGRASMVEATASLARVVSRAGDESSCSSSMLAPTNGRVGSSAATPQPRPLPRIRSSPANEPIYDIPSMSPTARESSITPDQKYPSNRAREPSQRRTIETIPEVDKASAVAKSSHILYLKQTPQLASRLRSRRLELENVSQLSRLATRGSRLTSARKRTRPTSWSSSTYSSCCSRCCPRRRLFSGRFRPRSHLHCSSVTCSSCTLTLISADESDVSSSSGCCSSCSASSASATSPGSLTQEYLRRHRSWRVSRRRLHRMRRLRKRVRRWRYSGSHGERMRHGRAHRRQPVLGGCELCQRRALRRPNRIGRYKVSAAAANAELIAPEHASPTGGAQPGAKLLAPGRRRSRNHDKYQPLPVDDLCDGFSPAASGQRRARSPTANLVDWRRVREPKSAYKRLVINNLSGSQQVVVASRPTTSSPTKLMRDKLWPEDNYRRHAGQARSPTGQAGHCELGLARRRRRHRHRSHHRHHRRHQHHYAPACHARHASSGSSSPLAYLGSGRRRRANKEHHKRIHEPAKRRQVDSEDDVTQFRERSVGRKQRSQRVELLDDTRSSRMYTSRSKWRSGLRARRATSGVAKRKRRLAASDASSPDSALKAMRRSLAAAAKTKANDLQVYRNDEQIMNKFLVKTLTPQVRSDDRGALRSLPTSSNKLRFVGWQFVPRCQCSHCCLVEKLILRDTERKLAKKLG